MSRFLWVYENYSFSCVERYSQLFRAGTEWLGHTYVMTYLVVNIEEICRENRLRKKRLPYVVTWEEVQGIGTVEFPKL